MAEEAPAKKIASFVSDHIMSIIFVCGALGGGIAWMISGYQFAEERGAERRKQEERMGTIESKVKSIGAATERALKIATESDLRSIENTKIIKRNNDAAVATGKSNLERILEKRRLIETNEKVITAQGTRLTVNEAAAASNKQTLDAHGVRIGNNDKFREEQQPRGRARTERLNAHDKILDDHRNLIIRLEDMGRDALKIQFQTEREKTRSLRDDMRSRPLRWGTANVTKN